MHHAIAVRRVVFALIACCAACDTIVGLGRFSFDGGDECTGPSFDQARITPFLAADGSLPALPPFEAGPDVGPDADAGGG
jgi:hypothetical protein